MTVDPRRVERLLAELPPETEAQGSAVLRMARVVALAARWPEEPAALAAALRNAVATFESRTDPESVEDGVLAELVAQALPEADPLPPQEAVLLALAAVGDAIGAYHGSIDLGRTRAARETVRTHAARGLGYVLLALDFKRT